MADIKLITETDLSNVVKKDELNNYAKKSELENKVDNSRVLTDVPANAKFTDTIYIHPENHPVTMITGLHAVATSGDYSDLSGKPSIPTVPTKLSQLSNDTGFINGNYDNTVSGLTATTLKEAIDELKVLIDDLRA